jgi:hypothetical protein
LGILQKHYDEEIRTMVRQTYIHLSQEAMSEAFNQAKVNVDACLARSNTSFSETNQMEMADKDRKHGKRTNPSSECD